MAVLSHPSITRNLICSAYRTTPSVLASRFTAARRDIPHYPNRAMSSAAVPVPGKKEFLCIIPDQSDALQRRLRVRSLHFENIKPLTLAGQVVAGGAMVKHHTPPGETLAFEGSMVIYTVENIDEVWKLIKSDPYATNDVWDLEKVQIVPYVSAVREPLNK